jgi:ligand-binding SRPBCC domain-containing protein
MQGFQIQSELATPADTVWASITSPAGINYELMPLMRMTMPEGLGGATLDDVPLRNLLGRSWILLGGLIPVEYDDLTITERGPGHRFFEQSRMLTQKQWWHERFVEPLPGGCRVVDRLHWQGRVAPFGRLYAAIVPRLFRHRHQRLRTRFGALRA